MSRTPRLKFNRQSWRMSPRRWLVLIVLGTLTFDGLAIGLTRIGALSMVSHLSILVPLSVGLALQVHHNRLARPFLVFIGTFLLMVMIGMAGDYSKSLTTTAFAVGLYLQLFLVVAALGRVTIEDLEPAIGILLFIHVLGFALNLAFPDAFVALRATARTLDNSRIMGFQLNPNRFAFFSVLLALYYYYVKKRLLIPLALLGMIVLSGSTSGITAFLAVGAYTSVVWRGFRAKLLVILGIGLALAAAYLMQDRIALITQSVNNTIGSYGYYVRAAMLFGGYQLASASFPVGAGAGTFGSPLAGDSITYDVVGISYLPAISEGWGVHDSGIGSLLGEYGFLGVFVVLLGLYLNFTFLGRKTASSRGYVGADAMFMTFLVFYLSFFRAVVSSYYYATIILFIFLILRSLADRKPKEDLAPVRPAP